VTDRQTDRQTGCYHIQHERSEMISKQKGYRLGSLQVLHDGLRYTILLRYLHVWPLQYESWSHTY